MNKREQEYQRLYRNAKAKERRLKQTHNVDVSLNLLTPTEWRQSKNKKREEVKLSRFNSRSNKEYQYINLGKESVKRSVYNKYANENQKTVERTNYHKDKNLKEVLGKPFMIYDRANGKMIETDQVINDRITGLQKRRLETTKNRSLTQNTLKGLKRYTNEMKKREKRIKQNRYAEIQKDNYVDKVSSFKFVLKGSPYYSDYKNLMKTLKEMSPSDYEKFYYLADMGSIDKVVYISDSELGTPEGQEKAYTNMKAIKTAWETVKTLIST